MSYAKKHARAYFKSSSFQMALLFTILCGITAFILGYFGYYFYRGHYVGQTEAIIDTEMRHIRLWNDTDKIAQSIDNQDRIFVILDSDGNYAAGNIKNLPKAQSILAEGIILFSIEGNIANDQYSNEEQDKKYAAKIQTFPDGRRVLLGVDVTEITNNYDRMRWLSLLSIFLISLVVLVSYLISRFVAKGTNKIALTAREIMDTGDLSRRIETTSHWDDLGYMTGVLNECFGRIQCLMDGISHVSDNIAHDLKTPLTRLKNDLEDFKKSVLKTKNENLSAQADKLISEADHLLNTFNALLRIARIEAGQTLPKTEPLDLSVIIHDVIDLYDPIAEEKNITLHVQAEKIEYSGDRNLLFQVVANLLDNAIKFTPEQGAVYIDLSKEKDVITLSIKDNGVGVPVEDKDKIFDRFYRSDKSRNTPGSGLGLSMVKAVVNLHGGHIDVLESEETAGANATEAGLCVRVVLPIENQ